MNEYSFKGKKLLILGGAYLHNKVVEAAKEMGIYTIVTDNVIGSPAKKIADKYYDLNVSDVDGIVRMCKSEGVDAVLTVMLDFCQIYYQQICARLNLPCYGTEELFKIFTNKELFKKACTENGIDVIPTYCEDDLERDIYPILIKPSYSRGSRGQSICYTKTEAMIALDNAKKCSDNGEALIEKYMGDKEDFQVTYLVVDGNAYVVRTADRYLGDKNQNMDRVAIALSSPSHNTNLYMSTTNHKVCKMLEKLGIKNAPVFMQGFVDGGKFRFYDPGLRFPGGEYDRLFAQHMNINLMKLLIELAFTGSIEDNGILNDQTVYLNGATIFTLHSTINQGTISFITDERQLRSIEGIKNISFRHHINEHVEFTGTVNQRLAEFNILANNGDALKKTLSQINEKLIVLDENGQDMVFCKFDIDKWKECKRD